METIETREQDENNLEFRYSRSHRLQNAPQNVKDFYSGEYKALKPGLFRVFFQNKVTKSMFFVVIMLFALSFFITKFGASENEITVEGIDIELSAVILEDTLYCSLMFEDSVDFHETSNYVFATFNIYDLDNNLLNSKMDTGIYTGEKKYFRASFVDYESKKVVCELEFLDKKFLLKTNIK